MMLLLGLVCSLYAQTATLTVVSAATYQAGDPVAADMLAGGLANVLRADAAYAVSVADAAGVVRSATVHGTADGVVNFVVPRGVALGSATVEVRTGGAVVASGDVRVAAVAPGLFGAFGELLSAGAVESSFIPNRKGGVLPRPFAAAME